MHDKIYKSKKIEKENNYWLKHWGKSNTELLSLG